MSRWIRDEHQLRGSIFGIDQRLFFKPETSDPFRTSVFGQELASPIGVAAGPHTQMAQNIVTAWLCGARFIELKTIQTLDQLEVSKPCIDMEDAGYNVEWSQELRIPESQHEYINAWLLIHALHRHLKLPGDGPGTVFNMSVGYDMAGILKPNVQAFLDSMNDAGDAISQGMERLAAWFPEIGSLNVPSRLSDNVTLSTMHGCPPDEIGTICRYMLEQRGLHTYVKLNPTLLGPTLLRSILNNQLGYSDITVPDEAFGHDIKYDSAVQLIRELREVSKRKGLSFGVKLSNTLEVINHRRVFSGKEKQMYLSGRPLHALTVQVARKLQETFDGDLDISFAGGADAFNTPSLLACGMKTVTVCSDLLRSGGYTRLVQYYQQLRSVMTGKQTGSLDELIQKSAGLNDTKAAAQINLGAYAEKVLNDAAYRADTYDRTDTKSLRPLGMFDCIKAPCTEVCPIEQRVPQYMRFVKAGEYENASRVVGRDNTMPAILGRACHHPCQTRCVRTHLDQPVAIREIKRFIMDQARTKQSTTPARKERIAIIGAGPCGLAAADFLSRAGYPVTLFDARDREGGMISSSIPGYRASDDALQKDLAFLVERGVTVRHGVRAGVDISLSELKKLGFVSIVIAIGAQKAGMLGLDGENVNGVWDSLRFLRECREGRPPQIGSRVGVVGGGDVAMDCARTAWRIGADQVSVIYRRTRHEMPAQYDEVHGLIEEQIPIHELLSPQEVVSEHGKLKELVCAVMELGEPDAGGRRRPRPVEGKTETLALDTLIVAINQSGDYAWLEKEGVQFNRNGYIDVYPKTLETTVPGVYAGGDAIGDGPATIVKALGDGKRIAMAIRMKYEGRANALPEIPDQAPVSRASLQYRRAVRIPPHAIPERDPGQRRDFGEVVKTMDETTARQEAARCLDCDTICSYCVGVCPNLAFFTYEHEPINLTIPAGRIRNGQWFTMGAEVVRIAQSYQVAVLNDFCNECGNCVTFCPSAGKPYQDKPRIYLQFNEFERERDNAFIVTHSGNSGMTIRSRRDGQTHTLTMNGNMVYESPAIRAEWSDDWKLASISICNASIEIEHLSLRPAVEMAALLKGIMKSMPYLPVAEG